MQYISTQCSPNNWELYSDSFGCDMLDPSAHIMAYRDIVVRLNQLVGPQVPWVTIECLYYIVKVCEKSKRLFSSLCTGALIGFPQSVGGDRGGGGSEVSVGVFATLEDDDC